MAAAAAKAGQQQPKREMAEKTSTWRKVRTKRRRSPARKKGMTRIQSRALPQKETQPVSWVWGVVWRVSVSDGVGRSMMTARSQPGNQPSIKHVVDRQAPGARPGRGSRRP